MQLVSSHLHYGISRYPLVLDCFKGNGGPFQEVDFRPLTEEELTELCAMVARACGFTGADFRSRVTHNVAMEEQVYKAVREDGTDLVIPPSVQVLGNGFSLVWR